MLLEQRPWQQLCGDMHARIRRTLAKAWTKVGPMEGQLCTRFLVARIRRPMQVAL